MLSNKTKNIIFWTSISLSITAVVGSIVATAIVVSKKNSNSNNGNVEFNFANNDQQKYVNQNSLSILFDVQPLPSFNINNFLNEIKNNQNNSEYTNLLNYLIDEKNNSKIYTLTSGTCWIFDFYKNDNFISYYLATNIHVLKLGYSIEYEINDDSKIEFNIPYVNIPNNKLNNSLDIYLTQPNGVEGEGYNKIIANNPQYLLKYWVNFTNYFKDIIPLGVFNQNNYSIPKNHPYKAWIEYTNQKDSAKNTTLYIDNNDQINTLGSQIYNSDSLASDIGIIQFDLNPSDILNSKSNLKNTIYSFFNINFDSSTINENNKNLSYTQKILFLNELLIEDINNNSKNNKNLIEQNFIFNKINNNDSYTIGGYPGVSENNKAYVRYNCKTINSSDMYTINGNYRQNLIVWNNYYDYVYHYNTNLNIGFKNVNLGAGSSGSMVINSNNNIVGIYWGIVEINSDVYGMITPIMDDSNNIVYNWLNYLSNNKKNSELLILFSNLKTWYK